MFNNKWFWFCFCCTDWFGMARWRLCLGAGWWQMKPSYITVPCWTNLSMAINGFCHILVRPAHSVLMYTSTHASNFILYLYTSMLKPILSLCLSCSLSLCLALSLSLFYFDINVWMVILVFKLYLSINHGRCMT